MTNHIKKQGNAFSEYLMMYSSLINFGKISVGESVVKKTESINKNI